MKAKINFSPEIEGEEIAREGADRRRRRLRDMPKLIMLAVYKKKLFDILLRQIKMPKLNVISKNKINPVF